MTSEAESSNPINLVKEGGSRYHIVIPRNASQSVQYAARELQLFLKESTGAHLPIVTEKWFGFTPSILIGPCKKTRKAGLLDKASELAEDGVIIRSLGKDIALIGQNERGNLYSVYVFLEKNLGIRFLAWDCTHVPKKSDVILSEFDYSYSPPFMYRETLYYDSFPKEIAARQRLNGPATKCDETVGGKIDFYPYVHSFDDLFPEKEYFKDHPEYYGLQGGKRVAGSVHAQICLSNPEVLRIAKDTVLRWIEERHEVPIIDVSQNDGNGPCECKGCVAIVQEEGSQHGPILRFVNAIADEVAKKHPEKWIETLAYAYSIIPPQKTIPGKNVIIRLCHVGCFFHGFEKCKLGSDLSGWLDQWSKLTNRIFIWHYGTNFRHYLAPNPNLEGLAKDIKYYASHNVNGVMVQCNYQGHGGELAELRQYLCAQLMWNPSQDPMKIREEFCRGYYGKASEKVMEFLARMDELAVRNVHVFAVWAPQDIIPPEFITSSLALLEEAFSLDDDPAILNRIEKLMIPYWYLQLSYPEKYGLAKEDGRALLEKVKRVFEVNDIEFVCEGGEPNANQWLAQMEATYATLEEGVLYNLLGEKPVEIVNCADWRVNSIERDGKHIPTIFHHPSNEGDGDAVFEIDLPGNEKAVLTFATVISAPSADGVRFSILVDDKEIWHETKTAFLASKKPDDSSAHEGILTREDPFSDHSVDLSYYAGQKIRLTLRVNALSDSSYDWANWVQPRIIAADQHD
jgi:hypothetical protein